MTRRRTGRAGWVLMLIVVAAFWFFQHQRVPSVATPTNYTMVGKQMRIPVSLKNGHSAATWRLARTASGYYVALLYANGRLRHQFTATVKAAGSSTVGHTYPASGEVNINGIIYEIADIHVNPGGASGYVQLKPTGSAPGGNVPGNAAANPSGNAASP